MNAAPFILAGGVLACGLGIAWLLHRRFKASSVSGEATAAQTQDAVTIVESLIVGDVDAPLITITPLITPVTPAAPLANSAHLASSLQPLLGRAPELLRLGNEMGTKTLRVVFSPEVTRSLQDGTLTHVQDAAKQLLPVVRDPRSGRFVETGRVIKTGGVRLANVAAASWQIAAIATAQHYLGEINARLRLIEDRVADIQFFLESDRHAELSAIVKKLREYRDAIARGSLQNDDLLVQKLMMEQFDQRCSTIGEHARGLAQRKFKELETLEINECRNPRGSAERAMKWVEQSQKALELIFLA